MGTGDEGRRFRSGWWVWLPNEAGDFVFMSEGLNKEKTLDKLLAGGPEISFSYESHNDEALPPVLVSTDTTGTGYTISRVPGIYGTGDDHGASALLIIMRLCLPQKSPRCGWRKILLHYRVTNAGQYSNE